MRLGLFGGTFDPIHVGHLHVVEAARDLLGLDRVVLLPAWMPPHKAGEEITPWEHRFAMTELACQDRPWLRASRLEGERAGPSYTVETLAHFRGSAGPDGVLFFLLGSDSLAELPSWKEHRRLPELANLVVVPRPGADQAAAIAGLDDDLRGRLQSLAPGIGPEAWPPAGRILWLERPPVAVSGTELRRRLRDGAAISGLVPDPVAAYISRHELYTDAGAPIPPNDREPAVSAPPDRIRQRLQWAVEAALEKKAEDIAVLDLRDTSGITDYFLICHGNSHRQVAAIVDAIDARLRAERARPDHLEGEAEAEWVLMDYLDFVVHVFTGERRSFYGLEKLWTDAPRLDLTPAGR